MGRIGRGACRERETRAGRGRGRQREDACPEREGENQITNKRWSPEEGENLADAGRRRRVKI